MNSVVFVFAAILSVAYAGVLAPAPVAVAPAAYAAPIAPVAYAAPALPVARFAAPVVAPALPVGKAVVSPVAYFG